MSRDLKKEFDEWIAKKGVTLSTGQDQFAQTVFDDQAVFLTGGLGSGRTFVFNLIDEFVTRHHENV